MSSGGAGVLSGSVLQEQTFHVLPCLSMLQMRELLYAAAHCQWSVSLIPTRSMPVRHGIRIRSVS